MSLGNILPNDSRVLGRPFDPFRFKAVFPDHWMRFLRAHHRNAEEVAVFYGVTFRTAENWWHGICTGHGSAVALAAIAAPEAFRACFGGEEAA